MLKNILELQGVQKMNKNEQKTINGGERTCYGNQMSDGTRYIECINDNGSFSYFNRMGTEITCNDIN